MRLPFLQKGQIFIRQMKSRQNRLFHRNEYDYLAALQTLSVKTKEITDLNSIISALVETVVLTVKTDKVILLLADEEGRQFVPLYPVDKRYGSGSLPSSGLPGLLLKNNPDIIGRKEI